MKSMEDLLPPESIVRVHKSYIIAIDAITSIFGNTIEIESVNIPIGSNFKNDFMNRVDR